MKYINALAVFTKCGVLNVQSGRQRVCWLCSEVFRFRTGTCHSEHIYRIVILGVQEEPNSPVSTRYIYFYSRYKLLRHMFTETWSQERLVSSVVIFVLVQNTRR